MPLKKLSRKKMRKAKLAEGPIRRIVRNSVKQDIYAKDRFVKRRIRGDLEEHAVWDYTGKPKSREKIITDRNLRGKNRTKKIEEKYDEKGKLVKTKKTKIIGKKEKTRITKHPIRKALRKAWKKINEN